MAANPADRIQIELRDEDMIYLKDVFPNTWADWVKAMKGATETDVQTLLNEMRTQMPEPIKRGVTLISASEMQLFFRVL